MTEEKYSPFVDVSDTRDVSAPWWSDGQSAMVRKLTFGEQQQINGATAKLKTGVGGKMETELDISVIQFLTIKFGLVSWSFVDAAGNLIPVSDEMINGLSPRDGDFIFEQVDEFNKDFMVTEQEVQAAREIYEAEAAKGDDAESAIVEAAKKNLDELEVRWAAQTKSFREAS